MTTSSTSAAMTTYPASFDSDDLVRRVAENLARVRARITATGRDPDGLRIVAVTKTFGSEYVRAARHVGLEAVGENYVEEMRAKRAATSDVDVRWHYLGALQSNKIHRVLECADVVCGVARVKELARIASGRPGASIYVQVDFTGALQRNGARPSDVAELVERARRLELDVRGLMLVAPPDPALARVAFAATRDLADGLGLVERSMGMSDDLEIACEEGTTEVRIGRALFGERGTSEAP